MRVSADRLATEGLRIEVPTQVAEVPHVIQLGPTRGISGEYEHSLEVLGFREIRGQEVAFAKIDWQIRDGHVEFGSGTLLRDVILNFEIDRVNGGGMIGSVAAGSAESPTASVRIGGVEVRGRLRLTKLVYTRSRSGAWSIRAETAVLEDVQIEIGSTLIDVGALTLKGAHLSVIGESRTLETHGLEIGEASVRSGAFHVEVVGVHVPRGVRYVDGRVELAEAVFDEITFEVPDMRDVLPAEPPQPPRPEPNKRSGSAPFDLRFVDGLNGQIDIDLEVDAKLAVVRRKKTHHFRVPLTRGEINYDDLEHDLSTLEDAFIDIEVRDGKLSLENDIPLLPGYYRSLVLFRLPPGDVERAKEERMVKLRTFAEWELPASKGEGRRKRSKSPFELKGLDFENIDVKLKLDRVSRIDLGERGVIQLGLDDARPPLESLEVTGDVHYRPGKEPREGHIHASLEGLHLALESLRLGGHALSIAEAHLGAVEPATLRLLGARPDHLKITLRNGSAAGVVSAPAQAVSAGTDPTAPSGYPDAPESPAE